MYPKILFSISLIIGLSIIIMVVLVGGLLVWNSQSIQPPGNITQSELKISIDGNLEPITDIQLPIDEIEAETIVKRFCKTKNPNYDYGYNAIKKVNNEWRIPIYNLNCPCYATVNIETGETNCMKLIPFETQQVTITTDKTEYEQGETIKVVVKNNLNKSTHFGKDTICTDIIPLGFSIERFEKEKWIRVQTDSIICDGLSRGVELKPKESFEFSWSQEYFVITDHQVNKDKVPSGKYRVSLRFTPSKETNSKTIYSNEFTIKEKKEIIVEVPQSIKLRALKDYRLSDNKVRIPKELYIDSYPPETEGYYIVQFKGPIYEEYKAQVIDLGGKIFDYIPENAFIVKMNESTKDKVQNLEIVRWVGIYQPAYKISPGLLNKIGNVILTVVIFSGENMTNISHKIESMGGIISVPSDDKVRVRIDASMIPEIANICGVKYIGEYVMPQLPPKEVFPGGGPK